MGLWMMDFLQGTQSGNLGAIWFLTVNILKSLKHRKWTHCSDGKEILVSRSWGHGKLIPRSWRSTSSGKNVKNTASHCQVNCQPDMIFSNSDRMDNRAWWLVCIAQNQLNLWETDCRFLVTRLVHSERDEKCLCVVQSMIDVFQSHVCLSRSYVKLPTCTASCVKNKPTSTAWFAANTPEKSTWNSANFTWFPFERGCL